MTCLTVFSYKSADIPLSGRPQEICEFIGSLPKLRSLIVEIVPQGLPEDARLSAATLRRRIFNQSIKAYMAFEEVVQRKGGQELLSFRTHDHNKVIASELVKRITNRLVGWVHIGNGLWEFPKLKVHEQRRL